MYIKIYMSDEEIPAFFRGVGGFYLSNPYKGFAENYKEDLDVNLSKLNISKYISSVAHAKKLMVTIGGKTFDLWGGEYALVVFFSADKDITHPDAHILIMIETQRQISKNLLRLHKYKVNIPCKELNEMIGKNYGYRELKDLVELKLEVILNT